MADLIRGTITVTDPSIAAEIAEHILLHNISGTDFLGLSNTCLRKWVHFTAQELHNIYSMQVVKRQR